MVIGAPGRGAAYIFRRNSACVWRNNQKLIPSDQPEGRAGYGAAVPNDLQMIIVGAPFAGEDQALPPGAAYVFTPGGGIYVETLKLDPGPRAAAGPTPAADASRLPFRLARRSPACNNPGSSSRARS